MIGIRAWAEVTQGHQLWEGRACTAPTNMWALNRPEVLSSFSPFLSWIHIPTL